MKNLNTYATTLLAAMLLVGLSACDKKSTSSTAAATPASACVFNPQTGIYTNTAGQVCNPNATQTTCPANGIYTNPYGQQVACTPGQVINSTGYTYPGQYPYGNYQNQTGCDQYYYQYGVQYVPVVLNGTLQCVRYDLVNQAAYGTQYYNNYDYSYNFPAYSYGGSGYCGTQVSVAWDNFAGSLCF